MYISRYGQNLQDNKKNKEWWHVWLKMDWKIKFLLLKTMSINATWNDTKYPRQWVGVTCLIKIGIEGGFNLYC